jgi:hypothetical protein
MVYFYLACVCVFVYIFIYECLCECSVLIHHYTINVRGALILGCDACEWGVCV